MDSPRLLHDYFLASARRHPRHPALEVPPGPGGGARLVLSYAELQECSDAVAARVRPLIEGECVMAILLPRSCAWLYSAQLGVLQSGAAFVCIDPAFPDEQVRAILEDSAPVALFTDRAGAARAGPAGFGVGHVFDVAGLEARAPEPAVAPAPRVSPSRLAYLIYTSGTTGRSKGVMVEHGSIANLVRGDVEAFALSPADRVVQGSSSAYDSSLEETWLAFAAGATLVVMDNEAARLGPDLIPWLRRERATVFCPPPTLLRATGCADPQAALPDLRLLYVGGEALPQDVADLWSRGRRLVNGYGPTECAVTALRGDVLPGQPVTIGGPVPGARAWVLNESLEEVPDGEPGELCVGGAGLARGYRGQPELTAEKFPAHPRLGRLYRTGDLAHRDAAGVFHYHGRLDAQVKLRGYRIELEAVESRLAQCDGVRAAACRVQEDGAQRTLVAFIVPTEATAPPSLDALREALRRALPEYMVPGRFGFLPALPVSVGGKLKRDALPHLDPAARPPGQTPAPPRTPVEVKLVSAFQRILRLAQGASIHDDFFRDLGGDSLTAAQLISLLRDDAETEALTVRDIYEARTAADLALRAGAAPVPETAPDPEPARPAGRPILATCVQTVWLGLGVLLAGGTAYVSAFHLLPFLIRGLGPVPLLLAAPLLALLASALYALLAVTGAVAVKRCLIGRYRPLRAPVWGSFHVRNWIVQRTVRWIPWRALEGTEFQINVLRALGARIGQRVHLHRGVRLLEGGWDLLDIGDDVTVNQDASIRLVELDDGQIVVGPVTLGAGCTLEVRAGVGPEACLGPEAYLTALSALPHGGLIPAGERWDGVPARPAGRAPARPEVTDRGRILPPAWHTVALGAARFALLAAVSLPAQLLLLALAWGRDASLVAAWFAAPAWTGAGVLTAAGVATGAVPVFLVSTALAARALGRVRPGIISRWSLAYVRVWLKTDLVEWAGRWLSGTLGWPVWLRAAGMKAGGGCEISTIIDTVPELVSLGAESFLADGIYLGGPRVHRGTVQLAQVELGENTFAGNHAVIAGPLRLPPGVLLGLCTVADDRFMREGSSWFGQPPFELPRREVVDYDRALTHDPSILRYVSRVFWEVLRVTMPVVPMLAGLGWLVGVEAAAAWSHWLFFIVALPALTLAVPGAQCLLVLALKWLLLGRVRPGLRAFWSCWCGRWDFLYVAWEFWARRPLTALEGTLWLAWYLRAMGARVGRRVVLGGGFAQVVDPDMLEIGDGATVEGMFQAHTFEDRVLKIDRVIIRRGATVGDGVVLLYGADLGARTHVAPHSVVMKQERLLPGHTYAGCPTRPVG